VSFANEAPVVHFSNNDPNTGILLQKSGIKIVIIVGRQDE
jgi:hypothetical protein